MSEDDSSSPKRITDVPLVDIPLRGLLFATAGSSIVFLEMPGSDLTYLPLFKDKEELERILKFIEVEWDGVKEVSGSSEFLASIPSDIAPICNIRFLDNGRVRFKQLITPASQIREDG